MASQGGSHEQPVKTGQQGHKNSDTKQAPADNKQSSGNTRGGSHDQHVKAGQQSHKNS